MELDHQKITELVNLQICYSYVARRNRVISSEWVDLLKITAIDTDLYILDIYIYI